MLAIPNPDGMDSVGLRYHNDDIPANRWNETETAHMTFEQVRLCIKRLAWCTDIRSCIDTYISFFSFLFFSFFSLKLFTQMPAANSVDNDPSQRAISSCSMYNHSNSVNTNITDPKASVAGEPLVNEYMHSSQHRMNPYHSSALDEQVLPQADLLDDVSLNLSGALDQGRHIT